MRRHSTTLLKSLIPIGLAIGAGLLVGLMALVYTLVHLAAKYIVTDLPRAALLVAWTSFFFLLARI